jgi:hypothetical protein
MKWVQQFKPLCNARIAPGVVAIACLVVLQFYAVRELLAAEVLFALAFLLLTLLVAAFYFIGSAAERGAGAVETGLHVGAQQAQRGYHDLEGITRRWIGSARFFHAHR